MTTAERMVPAILLLLVFLAVMAACATSPVQQWTETCRTYKETLRLVNDSLEVGVLQPTDAAPQAMIQVKATLSGICTAEAPPSDMDRDTLQRLLDQQLVKLLAIQNEVPQ